MNVVVVLNMFISASRFPTEARSSAALSNVLTAVYRKKRTTFKTLRNLPGHGFRCDLNGLGLKLFSSIPSSKGGGVRLLEGGGGGCTANFAPLI